MGESKKVKKAEILEKRVEEFRRLAGNDYDRINVRNSLDFVPEELKKITSPPKLRTVEASYDDLRTGKIPEIDAIEISLNQRYGSSHVSLRRYDTGYHASESDRNCERLLSEHELRYILGLFPVKLPKADSGEKNALKKISIYGGDSVTAVCCMADGTKFYFAEQDYTYRMMCRIRDMACGHLVIIDPERDPVRSTVYQGDNFEIKKYRVPGLCRYWLVTHGQMAAPGKRYVELCLNDAQKITDSNGDLEIAGQIIKAARTWGYQYIEACADACLHGELSDYLEGIGRYRESSARTIDIPMRKRCISILCETDQEYINRYEDAILTLAHGTFHQLRIALEYIKEQLGLGTSGQIASFHLNDKIFYKKLKKIIVSREAKIRKSSDPEAASIMKVLEYQSIYKRIGYKIVKEMSDNAAEKKGQP